MGPFWYRTTRLAALIEDDLRNENDCVKSNVPVTDAVVFVSPYVPHVLINAKIKVFLLEISKVQQLLSGIN